MSVTFASFHRARLIEKDWRFLTQIRAQFTADDDDPYLAHLLERKLKFARLLPDGELSPKVVTMNSRVLFRVGNKPQPARVIVEGDALGIVGATIPVTTAWGLTLLGLSVGQHAIVERRDGAHETLFVDAVLYQPESASVGAAPCAMETVPSNTRDGLTGDVIRPMRFARRA